ncbi:unnamed protein product, partial [Acanthoscelides obtectus]
DPTLSTRKLETVCGVSRRTVQRILKVHTQQPQKLNVWADAIDPALTAIIENQNDRQSPDLSPLDLFMWGHLKSKIYATQPTSLEDLRQRIVNECLQITPQILQMCGNAQRI